MTTYYKVANKVEYDWLMQHLEDLGIRWQSGDAPTVLNLWNKGTTTLPEFYGVINNTILTKLRTDSSTIVEKYTEVSKIMHEIITYQVPVQVYLQAKEIKDSCKGNPFTAINTICYKNDKFSNLSGWLLTNDTEAENVKHQGIFLDYLNDQVNLARETKYQVWIELGEDPDGDMMYQNLAWVSDGILGFKYSYSLECSNRVTLSKIRDFEEKTGIKIPEEAYHEV